MYLLSTVAALLLAVAALFYAHHITRRLRAEEAANERLRQILASKATVTKTKDLVPYLYSTRQVVPSPLARRRQWPLEAGHDEVETAKFVEHVPTQRAARYGAGGSTPWGVLPALGYQPGLVDGRPRDGAPPVL